eukprot:c9841_g1_i3.p2 GENE.c9841_g1_i3~~c9841_g1_i3.p2  ORF type:complete len:136 (+),score=30.90 c9841_g1_i3:2-409(+)
MPWAWHFRISKSLSSSLQKSLDRLNQPNIALYQISSFANTFGRLEWFADALADVHQRGLVKAVGLCNANTVECKAIVNHLKSRGVPLATNQVEYSLVRRYPEVSKLMQECAILGVRITAFSPLAMGKLTGKYFHQ